MLKSYVKIRKQNKEKFNIPRNVQQTVPVDTVYEDGIFRIGTRYSKSYRFIDINYSVSSEESKENIIKNYKDLLNSFDSTVTVKITINNRKIDISQFKDDVMLKPKDDERYDRFISEYNKMLLENMAKCENIMQEKYITVTCYKKDINDARIFFSRLNNDLSAHFSRLGSALIELTLNERLKILHDFYRNGEEEFFDFDLSYSAKRGRSFKDDICPRAPVFKNKYFTLGDKFGRVLYISKYPQFLKDKIVSDLCSINKNLMYSMDIISIPTDEAVTETENRLLGIATNIANYSRKQAANNNFAGSIPYDMEKQQEEIKEFLDDLTVRDEKMMLVNITIVHLADSLEELDADTEVLKSIARSNVCELTPIFFASRQLDALVTALPIGINRLDTMVRTLLTESVAAFMPFRAQEIMEKGGIWYGNNAITNNMIICNKENLKNPNAFVLGVPGAGKSFLVKQEIELAMASTDDDILICDPEGEYDIIMKEFGGEIIEIYAGGKDHINAMDITLGYGDSGDPYKDKAQFVLSLIESANRGTVSLEERSILDRCINMVYQDYEKTGIMPTLKTLREALIQQREPQAKSLALKMELFTIGSMDLFAHHTNVDTGSRIISYNIHKLDKNMKTMGLLVITDQIINRVNENWKNGKRTHIFLDEFHVVYSNPESATFFNSAWRQFRKRDAYPTGITQNVEYLLKDEEARSILSNTEFIVMLNQAAKDREQLAKLLKISDEQMSFITNSQPGSGLIKHGPNLVPFINRIPKETFMYQINTTNPNDRKERLIKEGLLNR